MQRISTWLLLMILPAAACVAPQPGDPCATTIDCGPDQICLHGYCRTICNSASDCAASHRCSQGACIPETDAATPPDATEIDRGLPVDASVGSDRAPSDVVHRDTAPADLAAPDSRTDTTTDVRADRPETATDRPRRDAPVDARADAPVNDTGIDDSGIAQDVERTDAGTSDRGHEDGAGDAATTDGAMLIDGSGTHDTGPAAPIWQQLSSGEYYNCGVKTDGTLWCWGKNGSGQLGLGDTEIRRRPARVGDATDWLSVATSENGQGVQHTCAIKLDQTLWCWGSNSRGQLGDAAGDRYTPEPVVGLPGACRQVSNGAGVTCAVVRDELEQDQLYCWGNNNEGQLGLGHTDVVTGPQLVGPYVRVSVGIGVEYNTDYATEAQTCAIDINSRLWCWGSNASHQISSADDTVVTTPHEVVPGATWLDVSAGYQSTCAISSPNGELWCWGTPYLSEVWSAPESLDSGTRYRAVNTAVIHNCAITEEGEARCWGNGAYGVHGTGTQADHPQPVAVNSPYRFEQLTAGWYHSCGLTEAGMLYCWGKAQYGALGNDDEMSEVADNPQPVATAPPVAQLVGGGYHLQALTANGARWSWGNNSNGQLGLGDYFPRSQPTEDSSRAWQSVGSGNYHNCGIDQQDRNLFCWGSNYYGQIGQVDGENRSNPTRVTDALVAAVGSNGNHSCAIHSDGSLWCWGRNQAGQLGLGIEDGDDLAHPVPEQVPGAQSWIALGLGMNHSCAIAEGGHLFCWGASGHGRLGLGDTERHTSPTEVAHDPLHPWTAVAAGNEHTCAIRSDKTLWCWGRNQVGQLGVGGGERHSPVRVGEWYAWVELSVGYRFGCGRLTNNSLWCWGDNQQGQLGLGDRVNRDTPHEVEPRGWQQVATALYTACAANTSGQLFCWGGNVEGQLGIGRAWELLPVAVH